MRWLLAQIFMRDVGEKNRWSSQAAISPGKVACSEAAERRKGMIAVDPIAPPESSPSPWIAAPDLGGIAPEHGSGSCICS